MGINYKNHKGMVLTDALGSQSTFDMAQQKNFKARSWKDHQPTNYKQTRPLILFNFIFICNANILLRVQRGAPQAYKKYTKGYAQLA